MFDSFRCTHSTGGAGILNTVVFHTRMVDQLDAVLVETSDLSIFCFYARLFEDYFQMCLEFPAQNRYDDSFTTKLSQQLSITKP